MENPNQIKKNRIFLGGVGIDGIVTEEAFEFVREAIETGSHKTIFIVTPNPEIIVEATRNPEFLAVLNSADLSLADGIGLNLIGKIFRGQHFKRIAGIDFVEYLLGHYSTKPLNIFILGGGGRTAQVAADKLKKRFPVHNFRGATFAPDILRDGNFKNDYDRKEIVKEAAYFFPDILLVGFGAPKQELWIKKHLVIFSSAKVAIGIGGALDFWAGNKLRAPRFVRILGFEWLWRLLLEPHRLKRIFRAIIVFPILILKNKIIK